MRAAGRANLEVERWSEDDGLHGVDIMSPYRVLVTIFQEYPGSDTYVLTTVFGTHVVGTCYDELRMALQKIIFLQLNEAVS